MRARSLIVVATALLLSACSLNDKARGFGESLIGGARGGLSQGVLTSPQRDSLKATMDSLAAYAGHAIASFLRPQIDTAIGRVAGTAEKAAREVQDTLIRNVSGGLNEALQTMLRANLGVIDASLDAMLAGMFDTLQYRMRYGIQPVVESASANAIDAAADRLAASLEGALLVALMGAADSIARKAGAAASGAAEKTVRESPLLASFKKFWPLALAGLLAIVVGVLLYQRRKRDQMLAAVAKVVQEQGDSSLRQAIKLQATVRQIEPDLNKWLHDRGYLPEQTAAKR